MAAGGKWFEGKAEGRRGKKGRRGRYISVERKGKIYINNMYIYVYMKKKKRKRKKKEKGRKMMETEEEKYLLYTLSISSSLINLSL